MLIYSADPGFFEDLGRAANLIEWDPPTNFREGDVFSHVCPSFCPYLVATETSMVSCNWQWFGHKVHGNERNLYTGWARLIRKRLIRSSA